MHQFSRLLIHPTFSLSPSVPLSLCPVQIRMGHLNGPENPVSGTLPFSFHVHSDAHRSGSPALPGLRTRTPQRPSLQSSSTVPFTTVPERQRGKRQSKAPGRQWDDNSAAAQGRAKISGPGVVSHPTSLWCFKCWERECGGSRRACCGGQGTRRLLLIILLLGGRERVSGWRREEEESLGAGTGLMEPQLRPMTEMRERDGGSREERESGANKR